MSKADGRPSAAPDLAPALNGPVLKGAGLLALIAIVIAFPQVYTNPAVTN